MTSIRNPRHAPRRGRAAVLALALIGVLAAPPRLAAAPAAGTQIGNQASATYTDASGVPQTATSNVVLTTVLPVYAVDVEQALSQTAVPASSSSFPVSVTNNGNDDDSFTLDVTDNGGDFTCASVAIYADDNADGVPDDFTNLDGTTVGPLAAGATANFVAICQVPGTASDGDQNTITVEATSVNDGDVSDSVTDTTTVTGDAVITLSKALSASSGAAGSGPHTVTLTYTNNGNATASDVIVTDLLDPDFEYVAGSARWSDAPAVVLTDADATDVQGSAPDTIVYDFDVTAADTLTAVISQVIPGQSGTLTFQVNVAASASPGTIPNTAQVSYDDDGDGGTPPATTTSNTTLFTVEPTPGVSIVGPATIASATPGATVTFVNTVTNEGDTTDTFDIRLENSSFPAGTGLFLYQSDGVTPLLNTGGNPALPDTGPVAAGATYDVVLKVVLPTGTSGGGPYSVDKVAISGLDPSVATDDPVSNPPATDTLTTILPGGVDVTNPTGGGGAGPEGSPVETESADPGDTVSFTLTVTNTGTLADTYDLAASTNPTDTGAPGLDTLTLPAGWTVVFRNAGGTVITNTGPVAAGASVTVTADVMVPPDAAAIPSPGQSFYFQALSPTSLALDVKHDAVIVNTLREVSITPNNTGQVFPGGSVVYSHTLTNDGNVTESAGSITLSTSESNGLWGTQLFIDVNGDGLLDGGDTPITGPADIPALDPGESLDLLARVTAPPGAATGSINSTTVTATPSGTINGVAAPAPDSATDTTTVISGNLRLLKEQALDTDCDGSPEGAYGIGTIDAAPGACVMYRLTATNAGTSDITNLVINDATPANTTLDTPVPANPAVYTVTQPGVGAAGTIQVDIGAVGALPPSASVSVEFGVQIEP